MKFQDGTRPSDYKPEEFTPERRQFLEEALKDYMKDFVQRMQEIKKELDGNAEISEESVEQRENLLDELVDIVCSLDYARDLQKIGGMPTLLDLLGAAHPSLRWRAAEVIATCVANNPPVQKEFLEGGALPCLLVLLSDSNVTVQTKGVLAISSLVRCYPPALAAFRASSGVQRLVTLLCDKDPRLQRKVLLLLQYLFDESADDVALACPLGVAPLVVSILTQDDSIQRQAALSVLVSVATTPVGWDALKHIPALEGTLSLLMSKHQALDESDKEAEQEEGVLLTQLMAALANPRPQARVPAPEASAAAAIDDVTAVAALAPLLLGA